MAKRKTIRMGIYKIIVCPRCGCENVVLPEEYNDDSVICELCLAVLHLSSGCGGLVTAPNPIDPALRFCSEACAFNHGERSGNSEKRV